MDNINYNHLPKNTEYSKVILQDLKKVKKDMKQLGNGMVEIFGEVVPCRVCSVANDYKIANIKDLGWVRLGNEKTIKKDGKRLKVFPVNRYFFYVGYDDNYLYWQAELKSQSNECYFMRYIKEKIHKNS